MHLFCYRIWFDTEDRKRSLRNPFLLVARGQKHVSAQGAGNVVVVRLKSNLALCVQDSARVVRSGHMPAVLVPTRDVRASPKPLRKEEGLRLHSPSRGPGSCLACELVRAAPKIQTSLRIDPSVMSQTSSLPLSPRARRLSKGVKKRDEKVKKRTKSWPPVPDELSSKEEKREECNGSFSIVQLSPRVTNVQLQAKKDGVQLDHGLLNLRLETGGGAVNL